MFKKRRKLGRLWLAVAAVASSLILSGCGSYTATYVFNKDGSIIVNGAMRNEMPNSASTFNFSNDIQNMFNNIRTKGESQGYSFIDDNDNQGITFTKTYTSLSELVNAVDLSQSNIFQHKGFLYDYYSLDLFAKGDDIGKSIRNSRSSSIPSTGDVRLDQTFSQMDQALYSFMNDSINSMKIGFSLQLPYAVDDNNATTVSANGTQLTWDLRPLVHSDQEMHMKAQFKIYHESNLIGLAVVAGILVILGIILITLSITKSENIHSKAFRIVGIGAVVVVLLGAGYVQYAISNPPALTEDDRIAIPEVADHKNGIIYGPLSMANNAIDKKDDTNNASNSSVESKASQSQDKATQESTVTYKISAKGSRMTTSMNKITLHVGQSVHILPASDSIDVGPVRWMSNANDNSSILDFKSSGKQTKSGSTEMTLTGKKAGTTHVKIVPSTTKMWDDAAVLTIEVIP